MQRIISTTTCLARIARLAGRQIPPLSEICAIKAELPVVAPAWRLRRSLPPPKLFFNNQAKNEPNFNNQLVCFQ